MWNVFAQASSNGGSGLVALAFGLLVIAFVAFIIVGAWRLYEKAGHPGWSALIPIYSYYILLKIAGRPGWWLLLVFVPFVNIVVQVIVAVDVAKAFGRSELF